MTSPSSRQSEVKSWARAIQAAVHDVRHSEDSSVHLFVDADVPIGVFFRTREILAASSKVGTAAFEAAVWQNVVARTLWAAGFAPPARLLPAHRKEYLGTQLAEEVQMRSPEADREVRDAAARVFNTDRLAKLRELLESSKKNDGGAVAVRLGSQERTRLRQTVAASRLGDCELLLSVMLRKLDVR